MRAPSTRYAIRRSVMSLRRSSALAPDRRSRALRTARSDQLDFRQHGFALGNRIGSGAFATVKTAIYTKSTEDGRRLKLACKIIDRAKTSVEYLTKFLPRELEVLKRINHPNIIQVHSIFQRKQKIYIFMQNADNGDLYRFIRRHGPIRERCAKFWFYQIATALRYLHGIDIAHRDLKCENVLLSRHMNAKLSDFGFAKICKPNGGGGDNNADDHDDADEFAQTMAELSRTYCGSMAYAAPEILQNRPYDAKMADIWSLGVILFIMVFAHQPFNDASYVQLLNAQLSRRIYVAADIEMTLTRGCKHTIRALLEPDVPRRAALDDVLHRKWLKKFSSST